MTREAYNRRSSSQRLGAANPSQLLQALFPRASYEPMNRTELVTLLQAALDIGNEVDLEKEEEE